MSDELAALRRRKTTPPVGAFGPSASKKRVIDKVMRKVNAAAEKRDPGAYYTGQVPTPRRITIALDCCNLYGPEVDAALGGEEPMVDEWEAGERVPTAKQIQALAKLTGFAAWTFYLPPPEPITSGFICGEDGCRSLAGSDPK